MDQLNDPQSSTSSWTYHLESEVRCQLNALYQSRCDDSFTIMADQDRVHLTTLLQMIQYIGHTVYDYSPLQRHKEILLKDLQLQICRQGDKVVRDHLSQGGIASKEHLMYMLVRNIRTKIVLDGEEDVLVLFGITYNEHIVTLLFEEPHATSDFLYIEEIPWMYLPGLLSRIQFELDTGDGYGSLLEHLGLPAFQPLQNFLKVSDAGFQKSLHAL